MRNGLLVWLAGACMGAGALRAQAPYETTQAAEGVYQFRWQAHNALLVMTAGGIVVVDPINPDASRQMAMEIRRLAPNARLRAIVYSHDHADHASGANVLRDRFGAAVPIIAHQDALAKIAARDDANQPPPTVTFADRLTLEDPTRPVELHFLGRSHSDNMIVALVPSARLAFAVDFVSRDRMGFRDLPDYHFPEFFDTLARLRGLDFDVIHFGHGPAGDRAAVDRQVEYYRTLRDAVAAAVAEGLTEDQAAERITLPEYREWGAYDWLPLNVRALYRWMHPAP